MTRAPTPGDELPTSPGGQADSTKTWPVLRELSREESQRDDGALREREVVREGDVVNGDYKILRLIAAGTMGRVYLAHQLKIDRLVALKIMRQYGVLADERFAKRFVREASVASQLSHPNIVSVFDYGETHEGRLFMVMEYLEGRPLSEILAEGPILPERAVEFAIQIARALRRAHSAGVVHRDLKPANVMVMRDEDGSEVIKVLDFGLVKLFAPESGEVSAPFSDDELTRPGNMVGTPDYVSPEQALGDDVDARTDIYALGVLLFHMVAGRLPFVGESIVQLVKQHLEAPVPSLHSVNPAIDGLPEIEATIVRAMAKLREDRFPTMEAFLEALKACWRDLTDESYGTELVNLRALEPKVLPVVDGASTDDMRESELEAAMVIDEPAIPFDATSLAIAFGVFALAAAAYLTWAQL